MLDRLVTIMRPYTSEEIEIITIKAKEQNVAVDKSALGLLTSIGVEHSLRYALQLLIPAHILAIYSH